jgi:hypothetical protein
MELQLYVALVTRMRPTTLSRRMQIGDADRQLPSLVILRQPHPAEYHHNRVFLGSLIAVKHLAHLNDMLQRQQRHLPRAGPRDRGQHSPSCLQIGLQLLHLRGMTGLMCGTVHPCASFGDLTRPQNSALQRAGCASRTFANSSKRRTRSLLSSVPRCASRSSLVSSVTDLAAMRGLALRPPNRNRTLSGRPESRIASRN